MERKELLGMLSILSFASILFAPPDSKLWVYLVMLGLIFGIGWLRSK